MADITVRVPDLGGPDAVDVIEVLVGPGDTVEADAPLIGLESDKATLEVPAPQAGRIKAVHVKVGDKVKQGDPIAELEPAEAAERAPSEAAAPPPAGEDRAAAAPAGPPAPAARPAPGAGSGPADLETEVLVLGAGPGGYTAAFRAADLGKKVVLVERHATLGGVCLNVGCIPSKALLHCALIIDEAQALAEAGIEFERPRIALAKLAAFKQNVVGRLTGGLAGMAKARGVTVVHGEGRFLDPHRLALEGPEGRTVIAFEHAIVAAGSRPVTLPFVPHDDPRVWDSTDALRLECVPERLLVVGGGIIGLEMAQVYGALGSRITVVELTDGLIPGCDRDLVKPLEKRLQARYEAIYTGTRVTAVEAGKKRLKVRFEGGAAPAEAEFDRVLVAVGRRPNGDAIGAEAAGLKVDERGFIPVDDQMRSNVPHIFAIGDIVGQPMLAHKAAHEGKIAAEVIAGHKAHFDARAIPAVAYTDPEVAWTGLTETRAQAEGIRYEKAVFPWAASGRALSLGRAEGLTKLLFDPDNGRLLGAGIVGPNAGELIGEATLAIEMGADAEDIGLTIHPHPTLSETIAFAAEVAAGTVTDLYIPKKK
ncbi:MAG: dihydrolipoyl dehydrogenase [Gammaproteobacteria bacterium]|nr:MAG: dihydrolipoyl dehydrogenase [Gammaproteobacteria bacterium]